MKKIERKLWSILDKIFHWSSPSPKKEKQQKTHKVKHLDCEADGGESIGYGFKNNPYLKKI